MHRELECLTFYIIFVIFFKIYYICYIWVLLKKIIIVCFNIKMQNIRFHYIYNFNQNQYKTLC